MVFNNTVGFGVVLGEKEWEVHLLWCGLGVRGGRELIDSRG